jgi:hypothetical protein
LRFFLTGNDIRTRKDDEVMLGGAGDQWRPFMPLSPVSKYVGSGSEEDIYVDDAPNKQHEASYTSVCRVVCFGFLPKSEWKEEKDL